MVWESSRMEEYIGMGMEVNYRLYRSIGLARSPPTTAPLVGPM